MSGGMTLLERKLRTQAARDEAERQAYHAKSLTLLIQHHCQQHNMLATLAALSKESQLSLAQHSIADNVDLSSILNEWEEFYERKYGRKPKLIKANDSGSSGSSGGGGGGRVKKKSISNGSLPPLSSSQSPYQQESMVPLALPSHLRDAYQSQLQSQSHSQLTYAQLHEENKSQLSSESAKTSATKKKRATPASTSVISGSDAVDDLCGMSVNGVKAGTNTQPPPLSTTDTTNDTVSDTVPVARAPLNFTPQYNEFASIIERDILTTNPNVRFSDLIDLDIAKQLLQEAIILPLRFPRFFTGLLSPWRGILLYGPPGTGKTMLAKAVATECRTTFFNISSSSITSKYRGDSEKLIRTLFQLAAYYSPSTIFIDEIDSLMSHRDGGGDSDNASEASRRLKSELLIQLDGLNKDQSAQVFVLCASNLPWDLDSALLRRLEKRILVPLPNESMRVKLVAKHLHDRSDESLDYGRVGQLTEQYSCSDIVSLCKEAAMRPVRRLMKSLLTTDSALSQDAIDPNIVLEKVSMADVVNALDCTRPTAATKDLAKYADWHAQYGATIEQDSLLAGK